MADLVAVITGITAAIELANKIADQSAGKKDLREALAKTQEALLQAKTAINSLIDEKTRLEEQLRFSKKLVFRDDAYWTAPENEGPFCTRCWDADRKPVRMHQRPNNMFRCPNCNTVVTITTPPPQSTPSDTEQPGLPQPSADGDHSPGVPDLSNVEVGLLKVIARDDSLSCTVGDFMNATPYHRVKIDLALKQLESRGLIKKGRVPMVGVVWSLTDEGKHFVLQAGWCQDDRGLYY